MMEEQKNNNNLKIGLGLLIAAIVAYAFLSSKPAEESTTTTPPTPYLPDTPLPTQDQVPSLPPPPPEDIYFLHGSYIRNNKEYVPAQKIIQNGSTFYIIQDGIHTKIVNADGVGKYYEGLPDSFSADKWGTYPQVPKGVYLMRACPYNCTKGCDEKRVCV